MPSLQFLAWYIRADLSNKGPKLAQRNPHPEANVLISSILRSVMRIATLTQQHNTP